MHCLHYISGTILKTFWIVFGAKGIGVNQYDIFYLLNSTLTSICIFFLYQTLESALLDWFFNRKPINIIDPKDEPYYEG